MALKQSSRPKLYKDGPRDTSLIGFDHYYHDKVTVTIKLILC